MGDKDKLMHGGTYGFMANDLLTCPQFNKKDEVPKEDLNLKVELAYFDGVFNPVYYMEWRKVVERYFEASKFSILFSIPRQASLRLHT